MRDGDLAFLVGQRLGLEELRDALPALDLDEERALPSVARASASAAATVVLPVPPLPLTTWSLLTPASLTSRPRATQEAAGQRRRGEARQRATVGPMTKWEYATVPLLVHATKQILDTWGEDGWELVQVVPGPNNPEQLVAYLKREKQHERRSRPGSPSWG